MLGFTYYWGRSRRGIWIVKRRTAKDRFSRTLRHIRDWCRTHRHDAVKVQHRALWQKLIGHYGYFGVSQNYQALARLAQEVRGIWRKWLSRRSQHSQLTWRAMHRLLEKYPLPKPRIVHSLTT
jgi:RNA-directed DNA polymerase